MNKRNPALVVGSGLTALGVMRNLGRNGVAVYCATEKNDSAVYSRYCEAAICSIDVERSPQELRRLLTKLEARFHQKVVVFPTSDLSALTTCLLAEERSGYFASIPERDSVETLVIKRKFYHSLEKRKVPHPKTLFLDESEDQGNIEGELQFPVLVKPSISHLFNLVFNKKGFVANSREELSRCLLLASKAGVDVVIQEILPGPATNHYLIDGYIDRTFKTKALFARQRIRKFPPEFGNSTICESIPLSKVEDIKETLLKYLVSIGYHGIFNAEFKKDPRDGRNKLLEINARSWWYNTFPSACGVNIILMAYLDEIGEEPEPMMNYETGRKLIYFPQDLKLMLTTLGTGQFSVREWIGPLLGRKEWAFFAPDDLKPFLMSILQEAKGITKKEKIIQIFDRSPI